MKVLHLTRRLTDGAGIAAFRIAEALRKYTGIQVQLQTRETMGGFSECDGFPLTYRILCYLETLGMRHSENANPVA